MPSANVKKQSFRRKH